MADFKQAIEWMKEGKKVRRSQYIKNNYLFFQDGEIKLIDGSFGNEKRFPAYLESFEATDWEIYEEEDNWNLKDNAYVGKSIRDDILYERSTIKTLKEKLLEDIEKKSHLGENGEDNKCIDIIHVEKILDKRFGF